MTLTHDQLQMILTGKLELDQSQIRNSEHEMIVTMLERSWQMLSRRRSQLLAGEHNPEQLSEKEQGWLADTERSLIQVIEQADQAGLLKK